ncbi:MAG: ABC transporter ATP-binding protein/permease [Candidatus Pacearchaeota archaeon]|nr:ABC transporter ATP-binding protein/permease [Candidatus Pacearchaeota archaeon]
MLKKQELKEIFRLLSLMKKRTAAYVIGVFGHALSETLILIVLAFTMKNLINAIITNNESLLIQTSIIIVAVGLTTCITFVLSGNLFFRSLYRSLNDVRINLFRHVGSLPLSTIEAYHSGDIISRVNNDIDAMGEVFGYQFRQMLFALIVGIGSTVAMLIIDLKIGLIILGVISVAAFINRFFALKIRKINDAIQARLGCHSSIMFDLLMGFKTVKIFNLYQYISGNYDKENKKLRKESRKAARIRAGLENFNFFLSWCNFVGVLVLGVFLVLTENKDFGIVIALMQLLRNLNIMFRELGGYVAYLQKSLAGAKRIFEILDLEEESPVSPMPAPEKTESFLQIDNLCFSYPGEKPVLKNISLSLKKGEKGALVGLSGSGKSTLLKLLLGFYKPSSGSIMIDGKTIDNYTLDQLRAFFTYTPQNSIIFSGTVRQNIAHGNHNAGDSHIYEAARISQCEDFINNLPSVYDTFISENGGNLSGGQKQRLAIARTVLKDAPIVLLDEATASLDSENELKIQKAIAVSLKNKTSLIVAHRLSTIKDADVIFVLDHGEIVEKGTHQILYKKRGLYYRFCEKKIKK